MSLDFSGLKDLPGQSLAQAAKGWSPPTLDDLGLGTVLCFDQSLMATGMVLLNRGEGGLAVLHAEKFTGQEGDNGVATALARGAMVFARVRPYLASAKDRGWVVAHESPPNPNAVKGGGTSSLMSAQALHCAALAEEVALEMLGSQPAKKLVCGNANAPKTEAHRALKTHVLPWVAGASQVSNEATRDALLVGLLWLARRKP